MKQMMQLALRQQLTLTPQLQQAIHLLQLSNLELQQEVEQALAKNPLLEHLEQHEEKADSALFSATESTKLPPLETIFEEFQLSGFSTNFDYKEDSDFETHNSSTPSLQQHLREQLHLATLSDRDKTIAQVLIDAINEQGYLTVSLEEIQQILQDLKVDLEEIETVLHYIQHLDPLGVGARTLAECLELQLQDKPATTPWLSEALILVNQYLPLLSQRDFKTLQKRMDLDETSLQACLGLILSLHPRPGNILSATSLDYLIPDVLVHKAADGHWKIELNPEVTPRLRVNPYYTALARQQENRIGGTQFLKSHVQEAHWFIKSLQSRHDTLLKVASCIVEHQRDFLEQGTEAMRPLVLQEVADRVGLHLSTISRVTTQKYIHTPRGTYELKYFFSSHLATASGAECSSTAIRALIRKLLGAENAKKPLSDHKIADFLQEQGIMVARRTIAKYREAMAIPASSLRKQL